MQVYNFINNKVFATHKIHNKESVGVGFIKKGESGITEQDFDITLLGKNIQHSDEPNCYIKESGKFLMINGNRVISANEELTINYADLGYTTINYIDPTNPLYGYEESQQQDIRENAELMESYILKEQEEIPETESLEESSIEEDLFEVDKDDVRITSLPSGFYTPEEVLNMVEFGEADYNISDDHKSWFEYYTKCVKGVVPFNEKQEAYWHQAVKEAYEKGDDALLRAHAWNPSIPFNSENIFLAEMRLKNAINRVVVKEYDITEEWDEALLEAAEEKGLVPVFVVFTASTNVVGDTIRKVTHSKVSHTGLTFDPSLKSWWSFSMGKGVVRESKQQQINLNGKDMPFSVFAIFITKDQKSIMQKTIAKIVSDAEKWKYNVIGLLGTIIKKPITSKNAMFCSEFVDRMFKLSGVVLNSKDSALVTPGDLYEQKAKNIFKVYEGTIAKYSAKITERKVDQLASQAESPSTEVITTKVEKDKAEVIKEYCVIDESQTETDLISIMDISESFSISEAEEAASKVNLVPVYIVLSSFSEDDVFTKYIHKFTKSKITHAGIAFDSSLSSIYSFSTVEEKATGGVVKESLRFYSRLGAVGIIVFAAFVTPDQRTAMKKAVSEVVGSAEKWRYNFEGIFGQMIKKPISSKNAMFCSEFVDKMFKAAGIKLTDKDSSASVSPADLYHITSKSIYKVYDGNPTKYSPKRVNKKVEELEAAAEDKAEDLIKEYVEIIEPKRNPLFVKNFISL